jgi:hypothetical protein
MGIGSFMAVEVTELVGSPKLWTDLVIHYRGKLADRVKSNSTPSAGREEHFERKQSSRRSGGRAGFQALCSNPSIRGEHG